MERLARCFLKPFSHCSGWSGGLYLCWTSVIQTWYCSRFFGSCSEDVAGHAICRPGHNRQRQTAPNAIQSVISNKATCCQSILFCVWSDSQLIYSLCPCITLYIINPGFSIKTILALAPHWPTNRQWSQTWFLSLKQPFQRQWYRRFTVHGCNHFGHATAPTHCFP